MKKVHIDQLFVKLYEPTGKVFIVNQRTHNFLWAGFRDRIVLKRHIRFIYELTNGEWERLGKPRKLKQKMKDIRAFIS